MRRLFSRPSPTLVRAGDCEPGQRVAVLSENCVLHYTYRRGEEIVRRIPADGPREPERVQEARRGPSRRPAREVVT